MNLVNYYLTASRKSSGNYKTKSLSRRQTILLKSIDRYQQAYGFPSSTSKGAQRPIDRQHIVTIYFTISRKRHEYYRDVSFAGFAGATSKWDSALFGARVIATYNRQAGIYLQLADSENRRFHRQSAVHLAEGKPGIPEVTPLVASRKVCAGGFNNVGDTQCRRHKASHKQVNPCKHRVSLKYLHSR